MANVVKMTIQFRRDTAANWELFKDITPAAGEPCFVIDKNILKIGDGVTTFEKLEPINGVKFELAADGKSLVLEDNILKLMGFDAAEAGAQPRKNAEGFIEWVVPAVDENMDRLLVEVDTLRDDVTNLQTDVTDIKEIVGSSVDGGVPILTRIESLEGKMDGTGDGTVDAKIDAKIEAFASSVSPDGEVNTLMELINYVETHGKEAAELGAGIEALEALVGTESVEDQISKAIANSNHMSKDEAASTLLSKIEAKAVFERVKYEITSVPTGTLVNYGEHEIRVMCPANTQWTKQNVGSGGLANRYYITFKAYAPEGAVSFKEDCNTTIEDQTMWYFENNSSAGVDKYGRKYSVVWLSVAEYDEDTDTWTYFGAKSTVGNYVNKHYSVEWYDANGVCIDSDYIAINLTNENCHMTTEPYYMANVIKEVAVNGTLLDIIDGRVDITIPEPALTVKGSDEIDVAEDGTLSIKAISFSKIVQEENEEIVLSGGGAAG